MPTARIGQAISNLEHVKSFAQEGTPQRDDKLMSTSSKTARSSAEGVNGESKTPKSTKESAV